MPRGPVLTVVVTSVNEGLDKGLKDAEKKLGAFGESGDKVAQVLTKLHVPEKQTASILGMASGLAKVAKVAAPVAGVAAVVAKLGAAGDKANTQLEAFNTAMIEAGVEAGRMDPAIAGAVKSATDMAFSGQQARDSLVSLQTATKDSAESARLLAVAQDVARLSGADLTVAADAVAKAYAGQDRQLKALIPGIGATASGMETIARAEQLAAGQAEIFANSAEGMGIKTKAALKGIAVSIGKAVAPAFKMLLEALLPLVESLAKLVEAILPALLPLLKGAAKAFELVARAITKVVDLVTRLINKIRELLAPLTEAINKLKELNPFKGQVKGLVNGNAVTVAGLQTVPASRSTGGGGGVTVNIYGDPSVIEAKVMKALRDYARKNGPASVFVPNR